MQDPLIQPIDVGDTFEWDGATNREGTVEVLSIYIAEDCTAQICVDDCGETRVVTPMDVAQQLNNGRLSRKVNDD